MGNIEASRTVARLVKQIMNDNKLAFKTFPKTEFLSMLRGSAEKNTIRIGSTIGYEIENALSEEGFKVFPHLVDVGLNESVRVFRSGSLIYTVLSAFLYPGTKTDKELASLLATVKDSRDILFQGADDKKTNF